MPYTDTYISIFFSNSRLEVIPISISLQ